MILQCWSCCFRQRMASGMLSKPSSAASSSSHRRLLESEQPPFAECHASTLIETRKGRFVAAWFAGEREGADDVSIFISHGRKARGKATVEWQEPRIVATGVEDGDALSNLESGFVPAG